MMDKRLIVIAGGSGGHVFPGLAVSNYLIEEHGWKVLWIGTPDHIEADLVPKHRIKISFIHIRGIRGKSIITKIMSPIHICCAVYQAYKIIRDWRPHVALGMGGYVSGPGGIAAWIYGIPVILHEQNSVAGLTNMYLSKIAYKVLQAFPSAFPKADIVGNPLRNNILALPNLKIRLHNRSGPIRVLVIGGSQGAQIFNQTMPIVAGKLKKAIIIWHQVGNGASKTVKQSYIREGGQAYYISEFIEDISVAYAWADVVVSRSGALIVSEISYVGLPALFVPFMHKDRQQYHNARYMEKINAAKIIEQPNFTPDSVSQILSDWDRSILLKMSKNALEFKIPDATKRVSQEIIKALKLQKL